MYKKWWRIVASWLVFVLAITLHAETSLAQTKAGVAATVSNLVFGVLRGDVRSLSTGSEVFTDQVVRTGGASTADLRLLDETSISVGPDSEITLDRFVYDPNRGTGNVVLNTTRGVFRFASGKQDSSSYHINTPVATIGVRGTKIEIEITDDPKCIQRIIPVPGTAASTKKMTLLLVSGKTEATLPNGEVIPLTEENTVVDICAGGGVQGPRQWVGRLSLYDTALGVTGSFASAGSGAGGGGQVNPTGVGARTNSGGDTNPPLGGGKQDNPPLTLNTLTAAQPVSPP
jgi:hypothetical protein